LFSQHANIWNFDLGKLVVPSVFMDYDLLEAMEKNYDQAIRVVRRIDGEILVTISPEEIRQVSGLGPLTNYHVHIDLKRLEKEHMSKKDAIRQGTLRAHIGKIGTLPAITTSSREPFKGAYFNTTVVEAYKTLCRVFREDEKKLMPMSFMYMITQISSSSVDIIFDFASFLAEEIHNGLVGIVKGKVEKIFGHYSLIMHMFLFKGVTYFGKEMKLNREQD